MTIEKMLKVINEYCDDHINHVDVCKDCKIGDLCESINGDFDYNEAECIKAYEIITGTVEHDGCDGCKHYSYDENRLPCSHCRGTVPHGNPYYLKSADLYEPEEPEEPKEPENPYWEKICELAEKQRSKGINKYGKGLEYNTADAIARINHLQEELIDGLMYCEWIKEKLAELEGEKA